MIYFVREVTNVLKKGCQYFINQLSVKTVASLLILVLTFNGILIPVQISVLAPFQPQTAYAALSSYVYKKNITFDTTAQGANVSSSQANFPVAVHINSLSWPTASERNNFFGAYNVAGKRIEFYDSDETTELSYEVEYYDQSSQEALYWVMVPQVDGNSSTDKIVVAYGNDPYGSDQDQPTSVWNSNYLAVYHLGDNKWVDGDSTTEAKDSTANSYHGDNTGSIDIAGQTRRGRDLDGTDDRIVVTGGASVFSLNTWTVSGWVNVASGAPDGSIFYKGNTTTTDTMQVNMMAGKIRAESYPPTSNYSTTGTTDIRNTGWRYFTGQRRSTATTFIKVFIDGAQEGTNSSGTTSAAETANTPKIGSVNSGSYFDGSLDELRISNTDRSADWIKVEYYSIKKTNYSGDNGAGSSKFITFGSE